MTTGTGAPGRPLRADAERNRQLIIDVATEVFAEKGVDAGFDEIARRACLGVGTVYRRFPDRTDLVEAILERTLARMTVLAQEALEADDAWSGLTHLFREGIRLQLDNHGLQQLLKTTGEWAEHGPESKAKLLPIIQQVLDRAKEQGTIRPDVELTDLGMVMTMVTAVHHPDFPHLWERYLTILLDGLQTRRSGPTPLPVQAPTEILMDRHFKARTDPSCE